MCIATSRCARSIPHAQMAAEAAEAVSALAGPDAFWRMHDSLFRTIHPRLPTSSSAPPATGVKMQALPQGDGRAINSPSGWERTCRAVSANGRRRNAVGVHRWRAVSRQSGMKARPAEGDRALRHRHLPDVDLGLERAMHGTFVGHFPSVSASCSAVSAPEEAEPPRNFSICGQGRYPADRIDTTSACVNLGCAHGGAGAETDGSAHKCPVHRTLKSQIDIREVPRVLSARSPSAGCLHPLAVIPARPSMNTERFLRRRSRYRSARSRSTRSAN